MSANTTIRHSAPFIQTGAVNPTARLNPYERGLPQSWDSISDQGHPGPGTSRLKAFEPFFGVSPGGADTAQNAYQQIFNWQQENYTLPDAYIGQNLYILNILITAIFLADQWPITVCLPWLKKEDSMEVQWMEWHFTDHMLDRSPEETVPRMLTNTRTQHSKGMLRFGKACSFEDGFLTTPMGRVNWAMSIKQIYNAIVQTACIGACVAIVQSTPAVDHLAEFRGSGNTTSDTAYIRSVMEQSALMFIVHKKHDGYITILDRGVAKFTNRNGKGPDGLIVPQGTLRFQQQLDFSTPHFMTGTSKGATAVFNAATSGMQVFESREYKTGEFEKDMDTFVTTSVFGGVFVMNDKGSKTAEPKDYKTQMRNTVVFDESIDNHAMIEFRDAMQYSGLWYNLFKDENPAVTDIGSDILPSFKNHWNILVWGGQDKVFLSCITHKDRTDTFKRFMKFASDCGKVSDADNTTILEMHRTQHRTTASTEEEGGETELDGKNDTETLKDKISTEYSQKMNTLLSTVKIPVLGVDVPVSNIVEKRYSLPGSVTVKFTDCYTKVPVELDLSLIRKIFAVANGTDLFRFTLDDTHQSPGSISSFYICPLEIPLDIFKQMVIIDNGSTSINTITNLEVCLPVGVSMRSVAILWLNIILSVYHSADIYIQDESFDMASFVNNVVDKVVVKSGYTKFNRVELCRVLQNDKDLSYSYLTGSLGDVYGMVASNIIRMQKIHKSDIKRSQPSSSAPTDYSSTALFDSPHIKEINNSELYTDDQKRDGREWCVRIIPTLPATERTEEIMLELLLLHRILCINDSEDAIPKIGIHISERFSLWVKMRKFLFDKHLLKQFTTCMRTKSNYEKIDDFDICVNYLTILLACADLLDSGLFNPESYPHGNELNVLTAIVNTGMNDILFSVFEKLDKKETFKNGYHPAEEETCITLVYMTLGVDTSRIRQPVKNLVTVLVKLYSAVYFNNNKRRHVREKRKEVGVLELETRIITILKKWEPTDARFIRFCLDYDLPVGFGLNCYRSHMTYETGTAVLMSLHGAAGNTFYGHANFMVGKDVQKKMTMGSFHMYCASVVTKPTLIEQIPCISSRAYICGNDTRFWDSTNNEHIEKFISGDLDVASIAPMIIPANWDTTLPFWDRTGKFGSRANVSRELEEQVDFPWVHKYNEKWNLQGDLSTNLLNSIRQPPKCNTRCFRDHQFYYNHATKMFDIWQMNQGPWGENVMPGCGKVRSGIAMYLQVPVYSQAKTFQLTI